MSLARLARIARKPPRYVARRAFDEARQELLRMELGRAAAGDGRLALARIVPADAVESTAAAGTGLVATQAAVAVTRADERLRRRLDERAEAAERRELELFGDAPVRVGVPPRWNEDVRSGHGWPFGHHRRIDYRNVGRPSDVKVAWELSRLRHLVALAQADAVAPDAGARRALLADLDSWIEANPMGWSVNWTCGMEIALRAVNLICADAILMGAGRPLEARDRLVASLYQHGWFLARHLEVSDLNGNHYLADAVGLIWLGRYFAGCGEAERWLRTGTEMVTAAAREQVLEDGLDHEGSLPYHLLVLEMFLCARHAAGPSLQHIDPILRRMADAALGFVDRHGRVPNLGDDDGGRVLAFAATSSRDARRVLGLAGVLLGTAGLGADESEDALWLTGRLPPPVPAPARTGPLHLAEGGIVVLGQGDDHVVVSTGPVGFRGRGGHGHLDAMSLEATLGGTLAVRDSGTASYTGDPGLRNLLRDASAHSAVLLDGVPYAQIGGEDALWAVSGDAPPDVIEVTSERVTVRQTLPSAGGQATLERTIEWAPGLLVIRDRLIAPVGVAVTAHLHTPSVETTRGGMLQTASHVYALAGPAPVQIAPHPWSEAYATTGTGSRLTLSFIATTEESAWSWTVRVR